MLVTYVLCILIVIFVALYGIEEFQKVLYWIELEFKYFWIKQRMRWMAYKMKGQLKRDLKRLREINEEIRNQKKDDD